MLVNMTAVQIDVVDLYEGGNVTQNLIFLKVLFTIKYIDLYLGPAIDGTDETLYINIFSLRNFVHLNKVSILYEATYGMSLSTVVTTEFAIDMGNALVSICKLGSKKIIHQLSITFMNCVVFFCSTI